MSTTVVGKRRDLLEGEIEMDPGDYGRSADHSGQWVFRAPVDPDTGRYFGVGALPLHTVIEHEDGTITVSPSILVTGHHGATWHGWLEKGIWREA